MILKKRKDLKGSLKLEHAFGADSVNKVHIQKSCKKAVHTKAVHEPVPGKDRKGK